MIKLINLTILCLALAVGQVDASEYYDDPAAGIKLEVFYESLCPDSIRFVQQQLAPVYEKIGEYFQPDLVPFGHARITDKGMICQHGPPECEGNRRMGCILERTTVGQAIDAIDCLMANRSSTETCIEQNLPGISATEIEKCTESQESLRLMKKYAKRSDKFDFVPYLVLQGQHTDAIQQKCEQNLLACICDKIDLDEEKPAACYNKRNTKNEHKSRKIWQQRESDFWLA